MQKNCLSRVLPKGKSITALVIEYGVLGSPDQQARSHFYFRDPLPYGQMDPSTAALFSDAHAPDAGAPERYRQLRALKARIERDLPDRVRHYPATWDPETQRVTALEQFRQLVLVRAVRPG